MKLSTVLAFALGCQALHLRRRANPSVLAMEFETRQVNDHTTLEKRADKKTLNVPLKNPNNLEYIVNFQIGTPPQNVSAQLDTGSSNLVLLTTEIELCKTVPANCTTGAFSISDSSTYNASTEKVAGSYADNDSYSGLMAKDVFTIDDATIDAFEFVSVQQYNQSATTAGLGLGSIIGIGFDVYDMEAAVAYPNLPYALANSGAINTPAYSLYLNGNTGHVLFGGVNRAKYTGQLKTINVTFDTETNQRDRLLVPLTSFGTTNAGKKSTDPDFEPRAFLLDSGSSSSSLPLEMFEFMATTLNVSYDLALQVAVAPCDLNATLDFTIGEVTISVPIKEIFDAAPFAAAMENNGVQYCNFPFSSAASVAILGDDFLRHVYTVYDLENYQIALAQLDTTGSPDDIVEIAKTIPGISIGDQNIPSSVLPYAVSATASITIPPGVTSIALSTGTVTIGTGTSTGTATGTVAATSTKTGSASNQVPAGFIVMACGLLVSFFA